LKKPWNRRCAIAGHTQMKCTFGYLAAHTAQSTSKDRASDPGHMSVEQSTGSQSTFRRW
jgi:hypothetical protein